MHFKSLKRIVPAVLLLLGACSPALYIPSAADASRTGISTDSLMIGRKLYVNHCGSCHNLHLPEQYTRVYWEKVLPVMKQKTKITDDEARLISNFILARSKPE